MPLSVISFLLLLFQIFHPGGDRNVVHKARPTATVHHGFAFRKTSITRNFVYAIADEFDETEHKGVVSDIFSVTKPATEISIPSFQIAQNTGRQQNHLFSGDRQLFLLHCSFRV